MRFSLADCPTVETDVLILGAGAAGLRAAIEACRRQARVTLLFKGPSSATLVAEGGHAVAVGGGADGDSPEAHLEDTIKGGGGLNDRRLVEVMVHEAPERLQELERWGVRFEKEGGRFTLLRAGGHRFRRTCRTIGGTRQLLSTLEREAVRLGTKIAKRLAVTKILVDGGRVAGAVAVDVRTGAPVLFRAKAVLLATGGAGAIYPITTCPQSTTGDGYALAYEAGTILADMEFVQFIPTALRWPRPMTGFLIPDAVRGEGARLYNRLNERFMERYDPQGMEVSTRDVVARAIYTEISAGRGTEHGAVYLDATPVPHETLTGRFRAFKTLLAKGIDMRRDWLHVAPAAHFFCGGVRIDEDGRTSLPGLYAAGEVTAGLHGANRLGGNALSEAQVFGARAGASAAEYALQSAQGPELPAAELRAEEERLAQLGAPKAQAEKPSQVRRQVRDIVWHGAGIVRHQAGLQRAMQQLLRLRDDAQARLGGEGPGLWPAVETLNMLTAAELVIRAALHREESRGTHFRADFPQRDDARWLCTLTLAKGPAGPTIGHAPVRSRT